MKMRKAILVLLFRMLPLINPQAGLSYTILQKITSRYDSGEFHDNSRKLSSIEIMLKAKPMNLDLLLQASHFAANLCAPSENKKLRACYINKAANYAQRSIEVAPTSKDAHLNYIIALGLLSEIANKPSEKLAHAQIIKEEAELLLNIDSLFAPAHFALGKWHLSLASLSWLEKITCELMFGGMPKEASLVTALKCFERAIKLQPDYILFYYNKALALEQLGHYREASKTLKKSLSLSIKESNDRIRRENCIVLLNKLNQKLKLQ